MLSCVSAAAIIGCEKQIVQKTYMSLLKAGHKQLPTTSRILPKTG